MSQLFFVINQDLLDGSAHALYCFRNCWWLAKTRPECRLELMYAKSGCVSKAEQHFGFETLPNLKVVNLTAVRRAKGQRGITLNVVFYWAVHAYLKQHARAHDWLVSAGFPKLFRFLLSRTTLRSQMRTVYEIHQLTLLDHGRMSDKAKFEFDLLRDVDCVITASGPLRDLVEQHCPGKRPVNLGLACGFSPADSPPRTEVKRQLGRPFTVAYIGSVYREQGVEWLLKSWREISATLPGAVNLEIIGGTVAEADRLRHLVTTEHLQHATIHGAVRPTQLAPLLKNIDALVIPSLPEGRMPYVAITKAYDYPGLLRPIVAADLPTIREVLRPGREALLFEAAKPGALAAALARLMQHPEWGCNLVAAAIQRAGDFSWETRSRNWWQHAEQSR